MHSHSEGGASHLFTFVFSEVNAASVSWRCTLIVYWTVSHVWHVVHWSHGPFALCHLVKPTWIHSGQLQNLPSLCPIITAVSALSMHLHMFISQHQVKDILALAEEPEVGQEWRSSAYSPPPFSIKPSAAGSSLDSSLALTRSDMRTFQNLHSNLGHLSLYRPIIFTLSEWTKCAKIIMLISKRHLLLKYKSNKAKSKFDK